MYCGRFYGIKKSFELLLIYILISWIILLCFLIIVILFFNMKNMGYWVV